MKDNTSYRSVFLSYRLPHAALHYIIIGDPLVPLRNESTTPSFLPVLVKFLAPHATGLSFFDHILKLLLETPRARDQIDARSASVRSNCCRCIERLQFGRRRTTDEFRKNSSALFTESFPKTHVGCDVRQTTGVCNYG